MVDEPFTSQHAKKLIKEILKSGTVSFTKHAYEEMAKDELTTVDCTNVLRGGVVEPPEWIDGTWRYRVRTARMCVVIAFRSETYLTVITAWRIKP